MKIENSLDWPKVEQELIKLGNLLPSFRHDIKRISENVRSEVTSLSKLEVEHRRLHNNRTTQDCQKQLDKINEILKTVSKFHLMALLAQ